MAEAETENSCHTQEKLTLIVGVTKQGTSPDLNLLRMIQKQGNWVSHELKSRNVT